MAVKLYEFKSAVRGYHYYMKFWSPVENQVLDCVHEIDNPYDFFAIKTMEKLTGRTVGHLPFEIARCMKFLLQRGAIIDAELSGEDECIPWEIEYRLRLVNSERKSLLSQASFQLSL